MGRRRTASVVELTIAAILSAGLTGCGGGTAAESSGGTYRWGINAELSGGLSFYGKSIETGVKAYVDRTNAAGGINGHKIEVVSLDNAGTSARAATNAAQLATADNVNAMFGLVLSANCAAATPVAERYKVPLACLSVAEPNEYVYVMGANNTRSAGAMLESAKKVSGVGRPKAALLWVNTLTTMQMAKSVQQQAGGAGVDIVSAQELDLAAVDFSAPVAKIAASSPDVILVSNFGPAFLSIVKAARAAGITAPFVWLDGTGNLTSLSASADQNVYALTVYELVDPAAAGGAAKDYIDAVGPTLEKGDAVSLNAGYTAMGYVTARAFGTAPEQCGYPCSGQELAQKLGALQMDLQGLVPGFSYTDKGHYPYPDWHLYRVVGEKYDRVATFDTQ